MNSILGIRFLRNYLIKRMLFSIYRFTKSIECLNVKSEVTKLIIIDLGKLGRAKLYRLTPLEVVALFVLLAFLAAIALMH
jgi:hypothetical protein